MMFKNGWLHGIINFYSKTRTISISYDNDNPTGALLSTRYSGEYISFGTGENNLYRIVSHENGAGTKITSAVPLKDNGNYKCSDSDNCITGTSYRIHWKDDFLQT